MQEFLAGFVMWPNVAWLPVSLAIFLFMYIAQRDGKMWNGWAAMFHFLCTAVAGLSWIFGQTVAEPDSIYFYFSPHAFWINFPMTVAHLGVVWAHERKNDCLIAIDDD